MKRSEAREQAFALTFERTINRESVSRIIDAAGLSKDMIVDDFAERLAEGAEQHEAEIDAQIEKNIRGWKMNRLSKVSLSLLRLAIYEMKYFDEIPVSVSINEAVELCKKYATNDDASFVNGILATVSKSL